MIGKESINVVVCGPKGSGKSSIIAAFVTGHFPESVQPTMPEVSIPPEEDEDGTQAWNPPPQKKTSYYQSNSHGTGIAPAKGVLNWWG